jgi:hypothetical protein
MSEFHQYLMNEMASEINTTWESDSEKAHEMCFLLSVDGQPVPETFFRFYAANINAEYSSIFNAACFFSGMGLLNIQCDCEHDFKNCCELLDITESPFFAKGQEFVRSNRNEWAQLVAQIVEVREQCEVN